MKQILILLWHQPLFIKAILVYSELQGNLLHLRLHFDKIKTLNHIFMYLLMIERNQVTVTELRE